MRDCTHIREFGDFNEDTGAKLKIFEDLCTDGTELNKVYLNNIDCWPKTKSDLEYCKSKFADAQYKIFQDEKGSGMIMFHSCCAFEWLKMCTSTLVELKCNQEARSFIDELNSVLKGKESNTMCRIIKEEPFTNCSGLYGEENLEIEERLKKEENLEKEEKQEKEENLENKDLVMILSGGSNARMASFILIFLPFILTKIKDYVTLY
ncbi:uncharacterized protein [Parasteatoda tepidariorum]|uniref:uncharacterized protein n=1 Tax=Parasteatoda tepidariorum TaxID=114398 RepID=UPI0039BD3F0B